MNLEVKIEEELKENEADSKDFVKNNLYDDENAEVKFFENMISPQKLKTTFLGRFFNIAFIIRLCLFELVMVSY